MQIMQLMQIRGVGHTCLERQNGREPSDYYPYAFKISSKYHLLGVAPFSSVRLSNNY